MFRQPSIDPTLSDLRLNGGDNGVRSGAFWQWTLVVALVLVAAKVVLVSDLAFTGLAFAGYDDQLFVRAGSMISYGMWLGPYDQFTLIKGPGYPLFMAGCRVIGLPLQHGQHLLYVAFCASLIAAMRPWLRSRLLGLILFGLLLFNPVSFHSGEMSRVVREGIYPALSGLVLACALGLAVRSKGPLRGQWGWIWALGFSLGVFWITREEGVWLLPAVILLLGWSAISAFRADSQRLRRTVAVALPIGICLVIVNTVCILNLYRYGEFTTVEFRSRAFLDAYGALARIDSGVKPARVPVPRASREAAYAVSPTFRKLQPYLEGPPARDWIQCSESVGVKQDLAGGWFMWALRDAAYTSEHFASARDAMRFYRRMAREINKACDNGLIAAGPWRSGMTPPFEWQYARPALDACRCGFTHLLTFADIYPGIGYTGGTDECIQLFTQTTRSPMTPRAPGEGRSPEAPFPVSTAGIRAQCRVWITAAYQHGTGVLTGLAALVFVVRSPRLWRQQRLMLVVAIAIVAVVMFRLAILAWIDTTSFPGMGVLYLSPLYVMMLAFIAVGAAAACVRGPAQRSEMPPETDTVGT